MVLWWKPTFGAICSLGQIHHYDKYLVSDIQGIYQKKHFQSFKFALIIHYHILHISVIFVGNLESWIPKWYPINTYSRTVCVCTCVRACVCVYLGVSVQFTSFTILWRRVRTRASGNIYLYIIHLHLYIYLYFIHLFIFIKLT